MKSYKNSTVVYQFW